MARGVLRRVEDVFDCWFESGSMPYAQLHYPFENRDAFEAGFPADFVAEGLDQTRGWFYTLMVLSTALFDKPAFKNLVCNGLVLAGDGKKMSKRLKNYPVSGAEGDEGWWVRGRVGGDKGTSLHRWGDRVGLRGGCSCWQEAGSLPGAAAPRPAMLCCGELGLKQQLLFLF